MTREGSTSAWYEHLSQPRWAPPTAAFGIAWSILYPVIAMAYGAAAIAVFRGEAPRSLLIPVGLNLISNFAFSPIEFGLRDLRLAFADILIVWATIPWSMILIWPHVPWASIALIPYLGWVTLATALQGSLVLRNP